MTFHPDYKLRRPTLDDAQAMVDLSNASDIVATGQPQTDLTQVYDQWNAPYFDINRDAWVVETLNDRMAGYMECYYEPGDEEVRLFYYLHPDFADVGLDAAMLALGEQHAQALAAAIPSDQPLELLTAFYATEAVGRRAAEASGFSVVRFFYRMDIEFDAPPPAVPDLAGATIRPYDPEKDEFALYEAIEASFEDHWRHRRASFDEWRTAKIESDSYDPALWVVAEADGQVIGGALGMVLAGVPWVRMLGVRREWRKRGIARAVLLAMFNLFYARGDRRVGLGVDASNPTGATRLYESAGMHISDQRVVYTKPLSRKATT